MMKFKNKIKRNKSGQQKIQFSDEHKKYIKKTKREKNIVLICQISLLVLIFGLWELLTQIKVLDAFFLSSPSRMFTTAVSLFKTGDLLKHIGVTLFETIIGFVLATSLGYIVAVVLWWSERLRRILDPYVVVLNSLPKIALGPLIIIWVGADIKAIIVMCILICVVITTLSMLGAFLSCDKDKILLMKSMNASKLQILTKLVIPNAMPEFVSVLKINVGMSWVGTIMGEYLVSSAGIGYLIIYGGYLFKLDIVMTSTVILCILASGMYFIISAIESRYNRHRK